MRVKACCTGDLSLDVLRGLQADLAPDIDVEVSEHQMFFQGGDPPSWITLLAEPEGWLLLLGPAAALFAAEIVKAVGRDAWTGLKGVAGKLWKLAGGLAVIRKRLPETTELRVALPVPDEHYPSILIVAGSAPEQLFRELALFEYHLPGFVALVSDPAIGAERAVGGLRLRRHRV